jgi:protein-tyrosine phosphatase
MIDIHTHILPNMDDGAKDSNEALALIYLLKGQGITSAVLTPHFYPHEESLTSFLKRRQASYEELTSFIAESDQELKGNFKLILGSETYLSETLFSYQGIDQLLIADTSYLLLELPYSDRWGSMVFKQIDRLTSKFDIIPIIAHVERYEATKKNPEKIFQELIDLGCKLQFNAHSVVNRTSRAATLKLMKGGWVDYIGSDCHNLKARPPEFESFNQIVQRKLGKTFTNEL